MSSNQRLALRLSAYMSGEAPRDHVAGLMLISVLALFAGGITFAVLFAQDAHVLWCGILGGGVLGFVFFAGMVRHLLRGLASS